MKTLKGLKFAVVAGLLLVLALAAVPGASAQQGITWTTGIQVQNLGAGTATITLTFYNSSTGLSAGSANGTIPTGGSITYFPVPVVSANFAGSAVVSSDQPVAAIMNLLGNGTAYGGSANGLSAGSTTVGLPLIQHGNSGFDTWFNVQNAGSADAHITVSYKPGSAGTATTEPATIKAGAAHTFDQSTNTALGVKFIGSATITSDQPVVAVVNQVGKTVSKTLLTYDGFGAGSTNVTLPLVMANNSNFFTGISVQNLGNASTSVTITYGPNTVAGIATPAPDTFTLAAGAGNALIQAGGKWSGRYVGSAKITSTGQPLVAIVNQLRTIGVSVGSSYEGFNPTSLTSKISTPLLMAANGGFFTALQCANPGATALTINVTYAHNTVAGSTFQPTNITGKAITAGSSVTIFQAATGDGTVWGTNRYIGGATITATGGNIACIVNELSAAPTGDQFLTYDGISF